ncbi:MAG: shikimate dehydrogenase [Saprospiraceae bacterium]|nr:shikimate dehydrogenase [Saprospiraceae bacterium]
MRKFGLIGHPLKHSFSPSFFKAKFEEQGIIDAEYHAYDIDDIQDLQDIIDSGVRGLNVTIPYKEKVIPYMDELDSLSALVMSVNTIVIRERKLIGYNTDIGAFRKSVLDFLGEERIEKALILGTGGSSKTVEFVLNNMDIVTHKVSRLKGTYLYDELDKSIMMNHRLIINTTPLGMYPDVDISPAIPYEFLTENHFVMDLIYNPEKTLFLEKAQEKGAAIMNGINMLIDQAENSWKLWNQ